jgi:hypothetical protein
MAFLGNGLGEQFMKTAVIVNGIIFTLIISIAIYLGLDPKKWQTWLLSLYGFLTFFLVGIVGTGNFYESVKLGVIITFALIFGGTMTFWSRECAKKWLREQERKEEESYKKISRRYKP